MNTTKNIPIPPGTYFIGDPGYVIDERDDLLTKFVADQIVYKVGEDFCVMLPASENGGGYLVGGTTESDELVSDSGVFGVMPESLWKRRDIVEKLKNNPNQGFGIIITLDEVTMLRISGDMLVIGKYALDLGFYNSMTFVDYDHEIEILDGEENWQLWGEYSDNRELLKEGIDPGDDYWGEIGSNRQ